MAAANRRYLIAPLEIIAGSQLPSEEEVLGLLIFRIEVDKEVCAGGVQRCHENCH